MMDDEIELERQRECGPFHACQTIAELLVLVNAMIGIDAVDRLLGEIGYWREPLVEAADEIERVGLADLGKLIRRHARKAKLLRHKTPDRWRTASAEIWLRRRQR